MAPAWSARRGTYRILYDLDDTHHVVAAYGFGMGTFTTMIRRVRLRTVAPGMGLAPAR